MTKRRPTIGSDPFDALLAPSAPRTPRAAGKPSARPGRKVRATFHLPAELVEEAKNAVVALSGPPVRLTLAALVRDALARELERLRKAHHKGKPWPCRTAPLVGGRPVSR